MSKELERELSSGKKNREPLIFLMRDTRAYALLQVAEEMNIYCQISSKKDQMNGFVRVTLEYQSQESIDQFWNRVEQIHPLKHGK